MPLIVQSARKLSLTLAIVPFTTMFRVWLTLDETKHNRLVYYTRDERSMFTSGTAVLCTNDISCTADAQQDESVTIQAVAK